MAEEEQRHIEILSAQLCAYAEDHCFLHGDYGAPAGNESPTRAIDAAAEARIAAAGFQAAAIQAAIALEERAAALYAERADAAADPEERRLYRWLCDWERAHLNALLDLDRALIESVWHDNRFWPF